MEDGIKMGALKYQVLNDETLVTRLVREQSNLKGAV